MNELVIKLLLGPALIAAATLAARRWDEHRAGLLSAFPAIAGPVLLVAAREHGTAFAAAAAQGTLLGVCAFSAFALAYARTARVASWQASLIVGWTAAGVVDLVLPGSRIGLTAAAALAAASLLVARIALGRTIEPIELAPPGRWQLSVRMVLTALLVLALAAAAGRFGATTGGLLTSLPALACVLAVSTHRGKGEGALRALMAGMLTGMAGFAAFCLVVAAIITSAGVAPAFVAAGATAIAIQMAVAAGGLRRPRHVVRVGPHRAARPTGSPDPLECC